MIANSHFTSLDHLQGKLLIASPKLAGSCFEKAIIYICDHNESGAMGLVLNHVLPRSRKKMILNQFNLDTTPATFLPNVHLGGPVDISRGFILHSDDYTAKCTKALENGFSLSSSVTVLKDIVSGKGPENSIITLGYAGWGQGQMEAEIEDDSWLITDADKELIFHTKSPDQWEKAAKNVGIDNILHYSSTVGHA